MSVRDVLSLPYDEFLGWFDYFSRKPIGWREDNRTYLTILSTGAKVNPGQLFPSLKAIQKSARKPSQWESLKGSVFFQHIMNSVNGDKLKILEEATDGD
jgi:hypothetical protein